MTKEINVEDATEWDDEEAEYNVAYLQARNRYDEANAILEARGEDKGPVPEDTSVQLEGGVEPAAAPASELEGMTVDEVLDWVDEDAVRAAQALAHENEQDKPRKGVVEELEALLEEIEEEE